MKAVIWRRYGPPDVLQLGEVDKPTPKSNEILVRTIAATVFAGDCEMRAFDFPVSFWIPFRLMFGVTKPRRKVQVPGQELSGVVEAVGADVSQFSTGDRIFAPLEKFGACAEYVCLNDKNTVALKPSNMSHEQAATVPVGGLNALHFLRKAEVGNGTTLLVNGAAGSIGTFAVQIARILGARVTAVDSTKKLQMLRSIGADEVIDYTQQDFTQAGKFYDAIIDVVGKSPYSRSIKCLNDGGRYVLGNPRFHAFFRGLWTSATTNRKVIAALTGYRTADLLFLKELIEAGKLRTVIDRRYPLEQIVEAHRYVETGQKTGHVVINIAED